MRTALILVMSAAALGAAGLARAQTTAAQVLDADRAASDGAGWAGKGAAELSYDFSGEGMSGLARSTFDTRTGAFVDSQDVGPIKGANGFDGHAAWMQDLSGAVTPQAGGDTVPLSVNEAYRDANLWWRADRGGAAIEALAPRSDGDAHFDVLRVTPIGGKPFEAWFDAATHLLARTVEAQGPQTITTFFSDYRPVDGVRIAGKVVVDDGTGVQFRQNMTLKSAAFVPARPLSAYAAPVVALTDGHIANPSGRTTVPFQLLNNHIYLPVKVDGKGPFLFIFDTGGHDILTPDTAKALAVHTEGDAPGTGAGEGVVDTGFASHVTFQIGDLTLADQTISIVPITTKAVEGFDEQGMIGFEVLRRFVTEIDYGARTITFIDPARFRPEDQGTAVPFVFYSHLPQVTGAFEGLPGRFDIDTGSRDELTLTKDFADVNGLAAKHPKGVEAVDGWGVGGPSRSYVLRGAELRLGTVRIAGVVTGLGVQSRGAFADPSYQGNVGTALLKRFDVTFDYGHQRLYLKRLAQPPADTGVFDRAGFWINLSDHGFKIVDLTAGGAAATAGLKVGDEITAVDGVPAAKIPLTDLRQRLRDQPAGTVVRLDVLSGETARPVALTLKDQI
jgi:hypothetical protein